MDYNTNLEELFDSLAEGVEKIASEETTQEPVQETAQNDESHQKLAEDLYAGGGIMANGFVDEVLAKLAGSGVPAAGGGSANPTQTPRSKWEQRAARLAAMHGRATAPGDDTSVRAEDTSYPGAGHNRGKGGAMGSVNSQKDLG